MHGLESRIAVMECRLFTSQSESRPLSIVFLAETAPKWVAHPDLINGIRCR